MGDSDGWISENHLYKVLNRYDESTKKKHPAL